METRIRSHSQKSNGTISPSYQTRYESRGTFGFGMLTPGPVTLQANSYRRTWRGEAERAITSGKRSRFTRLNGRIGARAWLGQRANVGDRAQRQDCDRLQ